MSESYDPKLDSDVPEENDDGVLSESDESTDSFSPRRAASAEFIVSTEVGSVFPCVCPGAGAAFLCGSLLATSAATVLLLPLETAADAFADSAPRATNRSVPSPAGAPCRLKPKAVKPIASAPSRGRHPRSTYRFINPHLPKN